jgi:hypothetical protein
MTLRTDGATRRVRAAAPRVQARSVPTLLDNGRRSPAEGRPRRRCSAARAEALIAKHG